MKFDEQKVTDKHQLNYFFFLKFIQRRQKKRSKICSKSKQDLVYEMLNKFYSMISVFQQ